MGPRRGLSQAPPGPGWATHARTRAAPQSFGGLVYIIDVVYGGGLVAIFGGNGTLSVAGSHVHGISAQVRACVRAALRARALCAR